MKLTIPEKGEILQKIACDIAAKEMMLVLQKEFFLGELATYKLKSTLDPAFPTDAVKKAELAIKQTTLAIEETKRQIEVCKKLAVDL